MSEYRPQSLLLAVSLLLCSIQAGRAGEPATDPLTGLIQATDWELVRNNCIACHSSKLVTQQRGSPNQWLSVIRWMQKKQNLRHFEPEIESRIIAYLAKNYPPGEAQRRPAIPPDLMPPNPYPLK